MKIKLFIISSLILAISSVVGQQLMIIKRNNNVYRPPVPPIVYLINQGFEGTGYDNGETWTETSGSPLEDPDNTEWAITGSQNLVLRRSGGTTASIRSYLAAYGGTTNQTELYGYGVIVMTTTNANNAFFQLKSNTTSYNFIRCNSSGRLAVFSSNGATSASPTDGMPTNTPVHVYWHVNNTTGAGNIEWNTSESFSGSGSKYAAFTGGQTGMLNNSLFLQSAAATSTNWMDNIKVSVTPIYY